MSHLAVSPSVPLLLKKAIATGKVTDSETGELTGATSEIYPSYRVPLAIAYGDWKALRYKAGCQFVNQYVLEVECDDSEVVTKIDVRSNMQHAIPLIGQALLLQLETGNQHAVESILERMREEARTFHDFETLARVGRVYKDAADLKWEAEMKSNPADQPYGSRPPSQQMYLKSFEVYAEAYGLTQDWYVGINAATLALLTGKLELASQYAGEVAKACSDKIDHDKQNRYWLFATEGEAALILNSPDEALNYYQSAIGELTPGESGKANSSYLQAVRLWKHFGEAGETRVGPVLELFEKSGFGPFLKQDFLGRKT